MLITNFNAGELSPTLNGRIDIDQYYRAAAKIENFEIIPTGGINRRVGTKNVLSLESEYRLIPFIRDKNNSFLFCVKKDKIRIYKCNADGTLTLHQTAIDLGEDKTIAAFSDFETVKEIQYAQNYNQIVMVHRSHKPIIFEYDTEAQTFTPDNMHFDFYPDVQLDDDEDFVMLPKDSFPTCTSSSGEPLSFTYTDIYNVPRTKTYSEEDSKAYCIKNGNLYEYSYSTNNWDPSNSNTPINTLFDDIGKYPGTVAYWNNRLYFGSSNSERQRVWASAAPDTRSERFNDFTPYKRYVTVSRVAKDPDLHPFSCDIKIDNVDITNNQITLINVSQDFTGLDDPTKYYVSGNNIPTGSKVQSVTNATTIVIKTPTAPSIAEDKLNESMTLQLWRTSNSVSAEDYENKIITNEIITADCSFYFDLASNENDAIMFLSAGSVMTIGTESSVWCLSPDASAININAVMQGRYGSDDIQGLNIGEACVYFAQGRKGIREFYFNTMNEAFQTNNIALLAQHLMTESPAVDFDYVSNPYNRLFIARENGTVASLLYDKNNGIMAWNRIKLGNGKIRNVAVVRGGDQYDIIFFLVEHGTDTKTYTIEMMDADIQIYLDCWIKNPSDEQKSSYQSTKKEITIGSDVYVGYSYESDIISMPVVNENERKRIVSLSVRFLESYMPVMKCTGVADEKFLGSELPYSGIKKISYPGQSDTDVTFELKTDDIYPVNILSVNANVV